MSTGSVETIEKITNSVLRIRKLLDGLERFNSLDGAKLKSEKIDVTEMVAAVRKKL